MQRASTGEVIKRRSMLDLTANVVVLGLLWMGYSAVRGLTADDVSVAMSNAADVLSFQHSIGLPSESSLQQHLIERTTVLRGANVYYIAVHFPATVVFLAWVWVRHPQRFARVRNALVAVTCAGLVVHILYPLAPPRMTSGFVDTAALLGPSPYDLRVSVAANQIAAMPSLHVGWALLVSLGVAWIIESRWRFAVFAHPVVTAGVVVVTANHYWMDAIVATALVGVGWFLSGRADRLGPNLLLTPSAEAGADHGPPWVDGPGSDHAPADASPHVAMGSWTRDIERVAPARLLQ